MVEPSTLIILGAGASYDYGFPLGRDLVSKIRDGLADKPVPGELRKTLIACGVSEDQLHAFSVALREASPLSVDSFLETREAFTDVGKLAIAASLIPREIPSALQQSTNMRLYEYLFSKLGPSYDDVRMSRLRIVTFNYDRSLEYFLLRTYRSHFGLSVEGAAGLMGLLNIVHVYGDLTKPDFLDPKGRPYDPMVTQENVRAAANSIEIIHGSKESTPALRRARQNVNEAKLIIFLGFGFHEKNVERLRLQFDDVTNPLSGQVRMRPNYFGTAFHCSKEDRNRINRIFHSERTDQSVIALYPSDQDPVAMLQEADLFPQQ